MTRQRRAADVLVFGATSLVGSHFMAETAYRVAAAGRRPPGAGANRVERFDALDFRDAARVARCVASSPERAVVNFAARTDVDAVERERPGAGEPPSGPAWQVNTVAVERIARAAKRTGKYFVQLSTDFVFDGTAGTYGEAASRSPLTEQLSWYGWTKSAAERAVEAATESFAIVRIAYPYGPGVAGKPDFPHWVLDAYRRHALPPLYADQWITPTWIPDVSRLIERLLRSQPTGIFHVASPTRTTPFEFGRAILKAVEGDDPEPVPGSIREAAAPGRAPRPVRGGLRCERLSELGLTATDWPIGVRRVAAEVLRAR